MKPLIRAKVFISCGQRKASDEYNLALKIAERLEQSGFEPYIAVNQRTLEGLKENIFNQLRTSEYFLFVDFKRERIHDLDGHRGSLFCQQELAIAAFLNIDVIGFQERGVIQNDGVLQFIQANCLPFTDRDSLPKYVQDAVSRARWSPTWKRQLEIVREPGEYEDAYRNSERKLTRFFHFFVRNLDRIVIARNCLVFLESIYDQSEDKKLLFDPIEVYWGRFFLPNATILPESRRNVDAFIVFHETPSVPYFKLFSTSDSSRIIPQLKGPGEFLLTYMVTSDDFSPTQCSFHLTLGTTLDDIRFERIDSAENQSR